MLYVVKPLRDTLIGIDFDYILFKKEVFHSRQFCISKDGVRCLSNSAFLSINLVIHVYLELEFHCGLF